MLDRSAIFSNSNRNQHFRQSVFGANAKVAVGADRKQQSNFKNCSPHLEQPGRHLINHKFRLSYNDNRFFQIGSGENSWVKQAEKVSDIRLLHKSKVSLDKKDVISKILDAKTIGIRQIRSFAFVDI